MATLTHVAAVFSQTSTKITKNNLVAYKIISFFSGRTLRDSFALYLTIESEGSKPTMLIFTFQQLHSIPFDVAGSRKYSTLNGSQYQTFSTVDCISTAKKLTKPIYSQSTALFQHLKQIVNVCLETQQCYSQISF